MLPHETEVKLRSCGRTELLSLTSQEVEGYGQIPGHWTTSLLLSPAGSSVLKIDAQQPESLVEVEASALSQLGYFCHQASNISSGQFGDAPLGGCGGGCTDLQP